MRLTFIAPITARPVGGVAMIYELAEGMDRRGHDVHVFHAPMFADAVSSLAEIDWFRFTGGVHHHLLPPGGLPDDQIPAADVIFGFSTEADMPAHAGLPVVLVQGYKMLSEEKERHAYHAPCPKLCVASWLVEVGRGMGVPARQLVHVPLGLHHEVYRSITPLDERPLRVSFCYHTHVQKGAPLALEVLERAKRALPDLEAVVFSSSPPIHEIPDWVTFRVNPPRRELVEEIYNGVRAFLCTSEVEGFGLTNIEAMACGATLVTTDNGGSRDYALHDHTALVSPTGDPDAMVENLAGLLRDDRRRIRLAEAGRDYVARFDWDASAEILEGFLVEYLADPVSYGRPPTARAAG